MIHPKPLPERRARSRHRRGILLIINHAHLARVLAVKAEQEGQLLLSVAS